MGVKSVKIPSARIKEGSFSCIFENMKEVVSILFCADTILLLVAYVQGAPDIVLVHWVLGQ
jgi:hypothetical protein